MGDDTLLSVQNIKATLIKNSVFKENNRTLNTTAISELLTKHTSNPVTFCILIEQIDAFNKNQLIGIIESANLEYEHDLFALLEYKMLQHLSSHTFDYYVRLYNIISKHNNPLTQFMKGFIASHYYTKLTPHQLLVTITHLINNNRAQEANEVINNHPTKHNFLAHALTSTPKELQAYILKIISFSDTFTATDLYKTCSSQAAEIHNIAQTRIIEHLGNNPSQIAAFLQSIKDDIQPLLEKNNTLSAFIATNYPFNTNEDVAQYHALLKHLDTYIVQQKAYTPLRNIMRNKLMQHVITHLNKDTPIELLALAIHHLRNNDRGIEAIELLNKHPSKMLIFSYCLNNEDEALLEYILQNVAISESYTLTHYYSLYNTLTPSWQKIARTRIIKHLNTHPTQVPGFLRAIRNDIPQLLEEDNELSAFIAKEYPINNDTDHKEYHGFFNALSKHIEENMRLTKVLTNTFTGVDLTESIKLLDKMGERLAQTIVITSKKYTQEYINTSQNKAASLFTLLRKQETEAQGMATLQNMPDSKKFKTQVFNAGGELALLIAKNLLKTDNELSHIEVSQYKPLFIDAVILLLQENDIENANKFIEQFNATDFTPALVAQIIKSATNNPVGELVYKPRIKQYLHHLYQLPDPSSSPQFLDCAIAEEISKSLILAVDGQKYDIANTIIINSNLELQSCACITDEGKAFMQEAHNFLTKDEHAIANRALALKLLPIIAYKGHVIQIARLFSNAQDSYEQQKIVDILNKCDLIDSSLRPLIDQYDYRKQMKAALVSYDLTKFDRLKTQYGENIAYTAFKEYTKEVDQESAKYFALEYKKHHNNDLSPILLYCKQNPGNNTLLNAIYTHANTNLRALIRLEFIGITQCKNYFLELDKTSLSRLSNIANLYRAYNYSDLRTWIYIGRAKCDRAKILFYKVFNQHDLGMELSLEHCNEIFKIIHEDRQSRSILTRIRQFFSWNPEDQISDAAKEKIKETARKIIKNTYLLGAAHMET